MERVADANLDQAPSRFICSDDPEEVVERIGVYVDLGFEELLLHAPGADQIALPRPVHRRRAPTAAG